MADFDSPWKEALQLYFAPFLALFFPEAHADIDWSRGFESLDKELTQVAPDSAGGPLFVDKLMRVWRHGGAEAIVLVHVEVQAQRTAGFGERMYDYNTRLKGHYNQRVVSLAVLADEDRAWLPDDYSDLLWGWSVRMVFPTVKLLDWADREEELAGSANPFSRVVLAHLKALETRRDPEGRRAWKFRLVRSLYEQGFSAEDVRGLFRLIDWLMELPSDQKVRFWRDVHAYQQERSMPYMSTAESVGKLIGSLEIIRVILRSRFGEDGVRLTPELEDVPYDDQLVALAETLLHATNLEEARQAVVAAKQAAKDRAAAQN